MDEPRHSKKGDRREVVRLLGLTDPSPEETFDRVVRLAATSSAAPIAYLSIIDPEREWFKSRVGFDLFELPYASSFARAVVEAGRALEITDVLTDARFTDNPLVRSAGLHSFAGVPIVAGEDVVVGILAVADSSIRELSESQWKALKDAAELLRELLLARSSLIEDGYRALLEQSTDGVFISEFKGRFIEVNQRACELTGYTRQKLLTLGFSDLVSEHSRSRMALAWDELEERRSLRLEREYRRNDGTTIPVEVSVTLTDQYMVQAIVRDISDRKRSEEELRQQALLFSSTTDGVILTDNRGTIVDWNPAMERISGYSREEVLGLHQNLLTTYADPDAFFNSVLDSIRADGRWLGQIAYLRKDGSKGHCETMILPLQNDSGLMAVCRDITEHLETQAELLRISKAVENAGDGIAITDRSGQIIYQNPAYTALFGYSPGELNAHSGLTSFCRNPEAVLEIARTLKEGDSWSGDVEVLRKDGSFVLAHLRADAIKDATGEVIGYIGLHTDVTWRIERERELILARERAEEMNQIKSAFLANMSHEIRTPLSTIIGFADVLSEEVEGEEREFVSLIRRSGSRLLDTLNSVLDLAQLEGDALRLSPVPVDLVETTREVMAMFRPIAKEKKLRLEVDADEKVYGHVDPAAVHRVLTNLVSNAVKFTREGSVRISVSKTEAQVCISIADTGVGIAEEFIPHLFDEFRQESSGIARDYEGSGLGLTITKRLIDLMEGTIAVQSEKGKGSTFTITLPRAEGLPRPRTRVRQVPGLEGPRRQLLVVDDDEQTLVLMRHLLAPEFELLTASTAADAISFARLCPPDLALLDVNLGNGIGGHILLSELRNLYPGLPALAVTAYALPGDREALMADGFDEYISKPFERSELLSAVYRVLMRQSHATPSLLDEQ